MRPTSPAINCKVQCRPAVAGTTLIEMTVVLVILVIMAAAIVPRVQAFLRSENMKQLEAKISRLPAEAATQSVAQQAPVRIRVSGDQLIMEKVSIGTDGAIDTGAAGDQIKVVDMGSDMSVDNAQLNQQASTADNWQWTVYPDGTSDAGALEFEVDRSHYSLVITNHAASQWIEGDMPDQTQDTWTAGVLAQRT